MATTHLTSTAQTSVMMLEAALNAIQAGVSIFPCQPTTKQPTAHLLPHDSQGTSTWKPYQHACPDVATVRRWYRQEGYSIAYVCGAVSGNREGIDIDNKPQPGCPDAETLYAAMQSLVEAEAPGLWDRLVIERTPGGGYHLIYRCAVIAGNTKLAQRPATDEDRQAANNPKLDRVTLIETRGEGGYVVSAPSAGYELLQGDLAYPPQISPDERDVLLSAARSLNLFVPYDKVVGNGAPAAAPGLRPGEAYNQRATAADVVTMLEASNWHTVVKRGDGSYLLRRPGKDRGWSATVGHGGTNLLYVFSSNGAPFEPERAYTPFGVRAVLEHNGDFHAAASELYQQGYGDRRADQARVNPDTGEVEESDTEKETQAQTLITIAKHEASFFRTPSGERYARVPVGLHYEVWALTERSSGFKKWLVHRFYSIYDRPPSTTALSQALDVIDAIATFDAPLEPVYTRIGAHNGNVYLDLADEHWRAIEVTSNGWRIVDRPPINFRRPRGMLALPEPQASGDVHELRSFLNVRDEADYMYILAFVLGMFDPHGPYAHLALHGPRGSAKSTTTRLVRRLIDPNEALARSTPRDERDFAITAKNSHVVAFDNLSHLPAWLSDALCRLSTGAANSTRALYSDDEEMLFSAKRPAIMNGIEEIAVRGDLLDRLLIVYLDRIPDTQRCTEHQLDERFTEAHPRILGTLLDAVSTALRNRPHTRVSKLPRMADFALWVEAAAPALGWQPGAFIEAYTTNRQQATQLEIEASPIGKALLELLQSSGTSTKETTAGGLLAELDAMKGYEHQRDKPKGWPADATRMAGALRRIAPALKELGVSIEFPRSGKARTIRIFYEGDASDATDDATTDASVTPNSALESPNDASDADDAKKHTSSVRRLSEEEEAGEETETYRKSLQTSVTSVTSVTEALESPKTGDATPDASGIRSVTARNGQKPKPPKGTASAVRIDIAQQRFDAAQHRMATCPDADWSDEEAMLAQARSREEVPRG